MDFMIAVSPYQTGHPAFAAFQKGCNKARQTDGRRSDWPPVFSSPNPAFLR